MGKNVIKKFSFLVALVALVVCLGCSHNVSKKEAIAFVSPMIQAVLEYKKETHLYPKSLSSLRKFPYKIKEETKELYSFLDVEVKEYATLYAGYVHPDVELYPYQKNYRYFLSVDFNKSRGSKAVSALRIIFMEDESYKIVFYYMPPSFKQ